MSDIGLYGIEAFLVGLAMLVVAGVGLAVEGFLWRGRQSPRGPLAPALLGPLLYGALALALLYGAEEGSLDWKSRLDGLAWSVAGGGLLLWGGVRIGTRGRGARGG